MIPSSPMSIRPGTPLRRRGFTLVELLVAVLMSAIVVSVIATSWTFVSRHIAQQRRKSGLELETDALVRVITTQLRRSPRVISWEENRIAFILAGGIDTMRYEFGQDVMLRKDSVLTLISQGARVSAFRIERAAEPDESSASRRALLSITLGTLDGFGDSCRVTGLVDVPFVEGQAGAGEWNW